MFKSLDNPSHTMCQEAQRKPSGGESGSTKEAQQFVPGVVRQHKGSATMCAGDSHGTKRKRNNLCRSTNIYCHQMCSVHIMRWANILKFKHLMPRRYWRVHMHAITMQCLCRSLVFLCCETQNHLEDVVVCIAGRANPSWHGCDMCWLRFFFAPWSFLRTATICAAVQIYIAIKCALCKLWDGRTFWSSNT